MSLKVAKKAKAGQKPEDLIAYHLHKHLARTDDYWRVDHLHASDVTKSDFCPRYFALARLLNHTPKPRPSPTCEQVVFQQGRMHATMLISWLAEAGLAWGNWGCLACGRVVKHSRRPKACPVPKCQRKLFRYIEMRITSKATGIGCGIDLYVALPDHDLLTVVELKSYDKEKFLGLKMPLAEHRVRTSLYLRCLAECEEEFVEGVELNEARILYISKGGYGAKTTVPNKEWGLRDRAWSPFKEFTIQRDDGMTEDYVSRALPVHQFYQDGVMPKGVCPHALASRAENCELRPRCFSGNFPAGEKV